MNEALTHQVARRVEILTQLRRMLIDHLNVRRTEEEIDPDTPLFGSGLGLDSVDAVEVLVHLEDLFRVRLPNNISGRSEMRTLNSLVDLVVAREAQARER